MAGDPDPPGEVELIGEHEELGVEPAQVLEQVAADEIGAAFRHQHLARFRRMSALVLARPKMSKPNAPSDWKLSSS